MKKAKPVLMIILLIILVGFVFFLVGPDLPKLNPVPKQWVGPYTDPFNPSNQTEPGGGVIGSPEQ